MGKIKKLLMSALACVGVLGCAAVVGSKVEAAGTLVYNVDEATVASYSAGDSLATGTYIDVNANRSLTVTSNYSTATSEDGSISFAKGLLPGGNCNTAQNSALKVTSKTSGAIVGVYYTFSDSGFANKNQSKKASLAIFDSNGTLTYTFPAVAGSNKVAYYSEYTINSKDTTIRVGSSGSRLIIMGVTEAVGEAAIERTVNVYDGEVRLTTLKIVDGEYVKYSPIKFGYDYKYYTDSTFETEFDASNTKVTEDLDLYVQYTKWTNALVDDANELSATVVNKLYDMGYNSFENDVEIVDSNYTILKGCAMQTSNSVPCVSTTGAASTTTNAVKLELSKKGTLSILATTAGTSARSAQILDKTENEVAVSTGNTVWTADEAKAYEKRTLTYELEAGTYYFGGTNGMRVFSISFEEAAPVVETVKLNSQFDNDTEKNAVRFIGTINAEDLAKVSEVKLDLTLSDGENSKTVTVSFDTVYTSITDLKGFGEAAGVYYIVLELTDLSDFREFTLNATLKVTIDGVEETATLAEAISLAVAE